MRLFFLFLFSFIIAECFSQPVINRTFGTNTVNDPRLMASTNLFAPRYTDTTSANAGTNRGIDSCGAFIFTYAENSFWFRACSPKRWVRLIKSGDVQANNGLSVEDNIIQLGQPSGAVGDPAAVIVDRFIPLIGGVKIDIRNELNSRTEFFGGVFNIINDDAKSYWFYNNSSLIIEDSNNVPVLDLSNPDEGLVLQTTWGRVYGNGLLQLGGSSSNGLFPRLEFEDRVTSPIVSTIDGGGGAINMSATAYRFNSLSSGISSDSVLVYNQADGVRLVPLSMSAFVQDGNSFGDTAVLGTNDNFALSFETGGTRRFYVEMNAGRFYHQRDGIRINSGVDGLGFGGITLTGNPADPNSFYVGDQFLLAVASGGTGSAVSRIRFRGNEPVPARYTSGGADFVSLISKFNPTSGTATYASLYIRDSINQTGGANGITRGLWIDDIVTAAADYRALEITPDVGYAIFQSGTSASNSFAGRMLLNNATEFNGAVISATVATGDAGYLVGDGEFYIQLSTITSSQAIVMPDPSGSNEGRHMWVVNTNTNLVNSWSWDGPVESVNGVAQVLVNDFSSYFLRSDGTAWVVINEYPGNIGGGFGIDSTVISGTAGSVLFVKTGPTLGQDNSNFFWDNSNKRLGIGTNSPARSWHTLLTDAATNAVSPMLRLSHLTSGTATTGFGLSREVNLENASGTEISAGTEQFAWSDATNASEDIQYKLRLIRAGSLQDAMTVSSLGELTIHGAVIYSSQATMDFGLSGALTNKMRMVTASVFGTTDLFFQGTPGAAGYTVLESTAGVGAAISTNGANPILFAPNRVTAARINGSGELQIANASDQGAFTLQNTGGFYQNGTFNLNLGSDANGDTYYRNTNMTRLPIGTAAQIYRVNSGATAPEWFTASISNTATLDFGNTNAGTSTDLTITVTGAAVGDVVSIGVPNGSTVANGCFTAWVSATNTVTVRFSNNDLASAFNPASGTFKATVFKF